MPAQSVEPTRFEWSHDLEDRKQPNDHVFRWHTVTAVVEKDGQSVELYLNGEYVKTTSVLLVLSHQELLV